jgi:hypothetical protein
MARRSHYSFNKRQKERKQKEKAEKKVQRRLAKRQRAADDVGAVVADARGEGVSDLTELQTSTLVSPEDNDVATDDGEDPAVTKEP